MTSYLLLRNNKESGPYSLDDIVRLGLKAYDLVWVNGKSAAWRYPGEIPELLPYAPAVEEQPYDRFYKKNNDAARENEKEVSQMEPAKPVTPAALTPDPLSVYQPAAAVVPIPEPEPEPEQVQQPLPQQETQKEQPAIAARKSVFVTMPAGQRKPEAIPKPEPIPASYEKYQPASTVTHAASAKETAAQPVPTISITENPATAEIKYSQPLDEIKEMYVKTLQQRKQRIANKAFIIQSLKKVAVVAVIIGAGILIGLAMNSNGGKKLVAGTELATQTAEQNPAVQNNIAPATSTEDPLLQEPATVNEDPRGDEQYLVEEPRHLSTSEKHESSPITREKSVQQPEQQKIKIEEPAYTPPVVTKEQKQSEKIEEPAQRVAVNENTGERSRKTRNETDHQESDVTEIPEKEPARAEPKAIMSNNKSLASQVSVKTNDYQIVAFGGIRDLQLSVFNDSKYVLDKVLVELQYLKPSLEPFRVDIVTFKSVAPNGSLTIRMPDTNRGIKVRYRILNILSTQSAKDL